MTYKGIRNEIFQVLISQQLHQSCAYTTTELYVHAIATDPHMDNSPNSTVAKWHIIKDF